jgi:type VI secretion system secreted protein Hcp
MHHLFNAFYLCERNHMAQDIFLKISGINGESLDSAHKGEIEVQCWSWSITQESNMHMGSGGGAGKATVEDLVFVHHVDRASPNLLKYCLLGKHIVEAKLTMRKAGGTPLEYAVITMTDAFISHVHPRGSSHGTFLESVGLAFAGVRYEYVVQNQQGGSAGTVTAAFDIKGNREI